MSLESLTPLRLVSSLGQSVWIDNLSRESIRGGHLQSLIDEDSVVGATSVSDSTLGTTLDLYVGTDYTHLQRVYVPSATNSSTSTVRTAADSSCI